MAEKKTEHGSIHISPDWLYYAVFGALAVLTVLTWWVAYYDLGHFNDIVALGIAFSKASLVVLFFMHVKYSPSLTKLVVVGALAWLAIMFGLTILDYQSRSNIVPDPLAVPPAFEYGTSPEPPPGGGHASAAHGDEH